MNTILFDLDGTLLPMDQQAFSDTYYKALSSRFRHSDYDSVKMLEAVDCGMRAMLSNDGYRTNEEAFWQTFRQTYVVNGKKLEKGELKKIERIMLRFYANDFAVTRFNTNATPLAGECVELLKKKGYGVAVATNPFFPDVATRERIRWAGLDPDDFLLITTYENSCFCKPNLGYYRHVLKTLGKEPDDCLMVGNDVDEDMCAAKLGIDVFLIDECLINRHDDDTSVFKSGGWDAFCEFAGDLPVLI